MADAHGSGPCEVKFMWVQVPFPALFPRLTQAAFCLFGLNLRSNFMKYLYQLTIILAVSLVSEALGYFIPLPVPASVYGLVIMFLLLLTKVVKLEHVENVADFFLQIMPFFFVAPTVGLMTSFDAIKGNVLWLVLMCFVSTVVTIAVTGAVAQLIIRLRKKGGKKDV